MGRYKNRRELKEEAKELLSGRWKDAILLNLIPALLTIIVMVISLSVLTVLVRELMIEPASYVPPADNSGSGSTSTGIISAFLTIGISYTFLDWLRDPEMQIRPFKQAFQVFTKKYFLGTLLVYIFTAIFTALWTLLLVVPGIIKTFSYSQAYFIFKDRKSFAGDEKVSALDCITESRKMMDGHKWEYFVLQLSFLGWGILSILSFGIGFIWLNPYMNTTFAAFYKNLTENDGYDESVEVF
ncbi:DUF975 family protein [Carnobacterium sp. TMP28]|uniref:DUF975 family protein n=1 Tax=Carnobacterium sp. TMP28 TaxID=3397060 RepID=UPI0039DF9E53